MRWVGQPTGVARPRSMGRILVVDDEEEVRSMVARLLEGEGYQVDQASNGGEADGAPARPDRRTW